MNDLDLLRGIYMPREITLPSCVRDLRNITLLHRSGVYAGRRVVGQIEGALSRVFNLRDAGSSIVPKTGSILIRIDDRKGYTFSVEPIEFNPDYEVNIDGRENPAVLFRARIAFSYPPYQNVSKNDIMDKVMPHLEEYLMTKLSREIKARTICFGFEEGNNPFSVTIVIE